MGTSKHVILTLLIVLGVGIQGLIVNDTYAQRSPYLKILLFKFGGTADVDRKDKFDEFVNAICMAVNELEGYFISKGPNYSLLSKLQYKELGREFTPNSSEARVNFYENERALEIHTGIVGSEKDTVYVRDNIFLINIIAKIPDPIELTHIISAEEYNMLKNMQQAIICYALSMEGKRVNIDKSIICELLANSFNLVSNIDSEKVPFAKNLKKEIAKELKSLHEHKSY